ncbi:aminoglycoside phosphotransferase family protein [Streptomyces sp. ADMS]|uniref:aminoglycoside phosphotransferase family protein n=1 Tax=Streptomyces sp. ADMS TaxID=3071415 RepID=UPI00296E27EC|nr:aminoglycoside phosphotransferase family protein [Streptomyces sp. ADMS]MDW4907853.1 aminoglycoside phosphotransferase family protein [Streptomyces sp. ADMS]
MSAERVSPAPERAADAAPASAAEVIGPDVSAAEETLQGYHHVTHVIPLPGVGADGRRLRGKVREPRDNPLWFDRRCFVSEEQLLADLQGRVDGISELVEAGDMRLQRFIEGSTLGARHRSGQKVPDEVVDQLLELFGQMLAITADTLGTKRGCKPEDRATDPDSSEFLERLIAFAENRVYRQNLADFKSLFDALGVDEDSFKRLRKNVSDLTERPFCLLHADLHRENLILDRTGRLWTIDWELAMFGDPLYDLATHLYLMRYPEPQQNSLAERWSSLAEDIRPGSAKNWEQDLPKLMDFKRAQSVFTDSIRATQILVSGTRFNWALLYREASKVHKALLGAAEPLGLTGVPTIRHVGKALVRWQRERDGRKRKISFS